MRVLSYIAVLLVLFNVFFAIDYYQKATKPVTLTQQAIQPSIHLVNSKLYFEEDSYDRSIDELKLGIEEINRLRGEIHPNSEDKISRELEDLKSVYQKALKKQISKDQINQASVEMLMALTYSQVKAAKVFLDMEETTKCRKALSYAMYHVKNALVLSEGTKKDYEVQIYAEMNDVVKDRRLSASEMGVILKRILSDLEHSEVTFS